MASELRSKDEIRETVRERYAEAAKGVVTQDAGCCGSGEAGCGCSTADPFGALQGLRDDVSGDRLYSEAERGAVPDAATLASFGCGNPTAVADLEKGETVLDLGSGGGIDVLLSARRVGPNGKAYGVDMTDEMLGIARANQRVAGVENVEFLKGTIEEIPLPDDSVDVIISNCVINLSGDKPAVLREAARVLRPGGRFAVTDVVADEDMDDATRRDMRQWTGCIAGALTEAEFRRELAEAGFGEIEIVDAHRAHAHAVSAIIRARKPT
jgi:arsenite methyltransferase